MAERILAVPKTIPDDREWQRHPAHAVTFILESGVLDQHGTRLNGIRMILLVRCPPEAARTGETWTMRLEQGDPQPGAGREKLYRLDIKKRPGISPDHHGAPHAHRLGVQCQLTANAIRWTWTEAFQYFCFETGLSGSGIEHPLHFGLKS